MGNRKPLLYMYVSTDMDCGKKGRRVLAEVGNIENVYLRIVAIKARLGADHFDLFSASWRRNPRPENPIDVLEHGFKEVSATGIDPHEPPQM